MRRVGLPEPHGNMHTVDLLSTGQVAECICPDPACIFEKGRVIAVIV